MFYDIPIEIPHTVPVDKCKGLLKDPKDQYGDLAYWHGDGYESGWFSRPVEGLDYIPAVDQCASKFVVDGEIAKKYNLKS